MTETLLALRDLKNSELAKLFKTEKYFSVYGKTFIPYRKFESVREKQLIDSLSTSENMAVRVPKDNDKYSYSLKNFKRYTENFAVDIFYCVDDKRFCSPYKDGLRSLNVSKLRKFYASELVEYKKENKDLISVLENRNLNAEIVRNNLKNALSKTVAEIQNIEFSRDNYNTLFPLAQVDSPIEHIKLGENQFEKLEKKHRKKYFSLVYETLTKPSLVINEQRISDIGDEISHNYIKSFIDESKIEGFQSVIVKIGKYNVSVTSHNRDLNNILSKIIMPEQLVYLRPEVGQTIEQHTHNGQEMVNQTKGMNLANESAYSTDISRPSNPYYDETKILSISNLIQKNNTLQEKTMQNSQSVKSLEDISKLHSALKDALKEVAVPLEKIDFTRNNYNKLFPYSKIETPIESVKMGANQFEKLEAKERQNLLLAVHDTLKNPDLIISEQKENVFGEQEDNHIYAKSFLIDDKVHGIQSVVVSIDGENVSISTHERSINNIVNKIKKPDQLLYAAAKVRLLAERATGKQLVTVNPIRENEYVVSPTSNIQQQSESVKSTQEIATELVLEKLNQAKINVITEESAMQSILNAGIEVQKMAAHYGTNQNIENSESFNGYGVYVLSVNEENAKTLGLKIASKKYGNSFYINNQPLQEFLQERNFSPYWQSVISQIQNPSNENLLNQILTSDVKGNPTLLKEQSQISTLCSLNLINYKREQTYLYSVEIPDNDGTNYLFYDKTIGIESANRINDELKKIGSEWKVSRNDTGNSVYFNILSDKVFHSQKQASEFLQKIGYVGMETSSSNYIIFDDREMNINNRVQYMMSKNGEVYGFAYNGEIYADKNLMNSNVLAHEYTHLWDNYTKNANPELWERGKNVFKQTNIWNEVVNDPSYQNIKNNEDEILSECHARICGKFAQQVLERIAAENGENAKNAVIDWDSEVNSFIATEFGFAPELGSENYVSDSIKAESLKEFLATPMKDLMAGRGFEKQLEKETLTFEEAQKLYPNIVDLSEEFSNPAPTEKEVLEKLRSMVGEVYATATDGKSLAIEGGVRKLSHIFEGDNYKNDFKKTRKLNRNLAYNVEKLIHNAKFIEPEPPKPNKNKDYLLGMHNYEVPVFVNGHGFMARLEGEVIKNAPDFSSSHKTTEKTPTSEAQLDNNELLLKLQAAKVSNLYVVRKQRPLFKIDKNQTKESIKTIQKEENQTKGDKNMENENAVNIIKTSELFNKLQGWLGGTKEIYKGLINYAYHRSASQEAGSESIDNFQFLFYNSVASKIVDEIARDGLMKKMESFAEKTLIFDPDNINISRYVVDREDAKELKNYISELKERIQVLANQQRTNLADVNSKEARSSSDLYYLDSLNNILQNFSDVKNIYTKDFPKYAEQKEKFEIFKQFRSAYQETDSINVYDAVKDADEFYEAIKNNDKSIIEKFTNGIEKAELAKAASLILQNGGSHVQLKGINTQALNSNYNKDKLLSTKEIESLNNRENSSPQFMKSADNKNQELEQEDYIHSEEFISKFGDWEKANRIEKLKNAESLTKDDKIFSAGEDITKTVESLVENEDRKSIQSIEKELGKNIVGTYINRDTGLSINVSNRNITEISNHHYLQKEHIQAIQYIPEIIDRAVFIGDVGNEDKKKHPNIQKYKYFATGLNINGNDFTCKTVVGVDKSGNCYYDQSLSSIEKGKLIDIIQEKNKLGNLSPLITQRESEPNKPETVNLVNTKDSFEPLENKSPSAYYDKRLINICQVPQMSYLEMKNGKWQPTKEAIQAVKEGKLFIEKNGQNYIMRDEKQLSTPQFMKSVDNKNQELEQEDYIHSEEFISKFGDWKKAERLEKLRNSESVGISGNEILQAEDLKEYKKNAIQYGKSLRGEYKNIDSGNEILLTASKKGGGIYEILEHDYKDKEHLQSIAAIPQIIENSIYISSEKNEDVQKHPNIDSYEYYLCGLKIANNDYTVKAVVAKTLDGNRYYDHKLTDIEKGKLLDFIKKYSVQTSSVSITTQTPETERFQLKDKRLYQICQCPQINYLNKNLEPTAETIQAVKDGKLYVEKDENGIQILHDENKGLSLGKELSEIFKNQEKHYQSVPEWKKTLNNLMEMAKNEENEKSQNHENESELSQWYETVDWEDPIESAEAWQNGTQEQIDYIRKRQNEIIDNGIESLQENGGMSDAAIKADIEKSEISEEQSDESEILFDDTNGKPHYPQEIISALENFQRIESSKWNLKTEEKTAVFHLIQITEIEKNDFENSLEKLRNYMNSEEFKKEESNYAKILTPILLTSLGQDFDEKNHTFSSTKFSYKFSTDELKKEVPVEKNIVEKGEIKSVLGNDFTGKNVKLTQDFQNELIEKGIVKPEENFILINEVEAVAYGTKVKQGEPFVTLTIPVDNDGKTEFVQTKYYHVSSLEEPQKIEKNVEENEKETSKTDKNIIIYGKTKVPEFAMITQHGLENFKDMIIESYEESTKTYLLKSEDNNQNVRISENTLNVLTSKDYAQKAKNYTQDTKTAEKMVETQYKDFFKLRSNCANNFRHNLAIFCRKEANSPLDALKLANSLISQMPKDEKRKTKELLNLLKKDGQSVNEVIIETYHEAVKEVPLNEDYLNNKRYEKMIARPMYDTISTKGEKIDHDFNLKIGDNVQMSFKVNKNPLSKFSLKKENLNQTCTIISSSKEGNLVTVMDGNKSFYDVPRDTFLKEYAKKQKVENKMEKKVHRQMSMQIDIGR